MLHPMTKKPPVTTSAAQIPAAHPAALAEDRALDGYRKLAWAFDELFRIPGTHFRFGLDSIIGLVPGVGDIAVSALGAYALLLAFKLRAPVTVLTRMLLNIGVDTVLGSVPLIGDVFDATWKANTKNRRVLEAWLAEPARTKRRSKWAIVLFGLLFLLLVAGSLWLAWMVVSWMIGVLRQG
jgi:hypothetical protein